MSDEPKPIIHFMLRDALGEAKRLLAECPEWPAPVEFSEEVGDDGLPLYEVYNFGQSAVAMDAIRILGQLVAEMNAKNEQIYTLVDYVDKLKADNELLTKQRDKARLELHEEEERFDELKERYDRLVS